jgi:hypothetical protein
MRCGHVRDREMEFELVLSGIVLEEAIEIGLPTRERASIIGRSERTNLNFCRHA